MNDGSNHRLPRRLFGVQSKAATGAIEQLEGELRKAEERITALEAELRQRDAELARHREEESRIAAALTEAQRAAQRVVAEARREADAIVGAAETRRDEIATQADELYERCQVFLQQLLLDLGRHGDPRSAPVPPTPVTGPGSPEETHRRAVADADEPAPRPVSRSGPPLEDPPVGEHLTELEIAPVRSATHIADLERQIMKLDGVRGVRVGQREAGRVTFLVGTATPDLDVSPLLSEGAQLRAAGRDRIVLALGSDTAEVGDEVKVEVLDVDAGRKPRSETG